jgi:uncharacterized protein YjgD (DUF1641 family)
MAVPISRRPTTPESAADIRARLEEAEIKHAKAILAAYELLQDLHDAGVIELCRGALDAGDTIVTKLALATNSPEAINSVRNGMSLAKILSSVDPQFLHRLADEISKRPPAGAPRMGLLGFARVIFGKEGRRAMAGAAAFAQAFGRALAKP